MLVFASTLLLSSLRQTHRLVPPVTMKMPLLGASHRPPNGRKKARRKATIRAVREVAGEIIKEIALLLTLQNACIPSKDAAQYP